LYSGDVNVNKNLNKCVQRHIDEKTQYIKTEVIRYISFLHCHNKILHMGVLKQQNLFSQLWNTGVWNRPAPCWLLLRGRFCVSLLASGDNQRPSQVRGPISASFSTSCYLCIWVSCLTLLTMQWRTTQLHLLHWIPANTVLFPSNVTFWHVLGALSLVSSNRCIQAGTPPLNQHLTLSV
jgi:hypothetical protein